VPPDAAARAVATDARAREPRAAVAIIAKRYQIVAQSNGASMSPSQRGVRGAAGTGRAAVPPSHPRHPMRQAMAKSRSAKKRSRSSISGSRSSMSARSRSTRGASARTSGQKSARSRSAPIAGSSRGRNGSGRDDAIALGELERLHGMPRRVFAHHHALLGDARHRARVARRIGHVDAGAEHGDGGAACIECAQVRGGVDARGHAAGDAPACASERTGERAGVVEPARGGAAAADDRDGRAPEQSGVAIDVEHARCVREVAQEGRVFRLVEAQETAVAVREPALQWVHRASVARKRRRRPRAPSCGCVGKSRAASSGKSVSTERPDASARNPRGSA